MMKFTNDIEVAVDSIARWKNGTRKYRGPSASSWGVTEPYPSERRAQSKWLAQHWEEIEREMAEDRAARIKPESEAEGE